MTPKAAEWHYYVCVAALPQLDRGSDYESERHRFESCTPHQSNFKVLPGAPFLLGSPAGIRTRWGRETEQTRERLPASVRGRGGARSCGRRRRTRILYAAPVKIERCSSEHLFLLDNLPWIRTSLEARASSGRGASVASGRGAGRAEAGADAAGVRGILYAAGRIRKVLYGIPFLLDDLAGIRTRWGRERHGQNLAALNGPLSHICPA